MRPTPGQLVLIVFTWAMWMIFSACTADGRIDGEAVRAVSGAVGDIYDRYDRAQHPVEQPQPRVIYNAYGQPIYVQ